jgi:hypothetical protein
MTTQQWLDTCTEIRHDATKGIHTLADLVHEKEPTPRAKILAARAIASLARTTALTTNLRRELAHPGGKP